MSKRKITSVKSTGALEGRPVSELLEIYRGLGGDTEFRDKDQLVRAIIVKLSEKNTPGRRRRVVARHVEKEPKNRKPWAYDPTKLEPRNPRKGTKREKLIAMLRRPQGASFGEIEKALGWTYKQAFVQMRAVNTKNGYGFHEKNKRLTIYTYDEGPPE